MKATSNFQSSAVCDRPLLRPDRIRRRMREPGAGALSAERWLLALFLWLAGLSFARGQALTENQLSGIRFDQKLNAQVSLDLPFRDENGRAVVLGDYFGKKPVVLVLGYYECPMLCTLTFNGMVESMEDMKWSIGNQFNVVHVSINPSETPELAAAKKQAYLKRYGRAGAAGGWHFLTGDEPSIRRLADQVGFHYAYDPSVRQYAHPSGLVVLKPDGKVAKYFFGVTFSPNDLYAALAGASENRVGSPIRQLVLLCFHYSPLKGKYGALIMTVVRLLAIVTLGGMVWMFAALVRREKKRRECGRPAPAQPPAGEPAGCRGGEQSRADAGRSIL